MIFIPFCTYLVNPNDEPRATRLEVSLKIDGVNWPGQLRPQSGLGELGLKDGQIIVGRILGITTDEVLLQLAGKTLTAQLEGRPLLPGAVARFAVTVADSGQVVLKVLADHGESPGETAPTLAMRYFTDETELKTAIMAAYRHLGREGTPAQIDQICRDLRSFVALHGKTPPPEVLVWLRTQNWPVTSGTILLAWLYRDQQLRNLIWTRLQWIAKLKNQPELLPPVCDGDQYPPQAETTGCQKAIPTGARNALGNGTRPALVMTHDFQTMPDPLLHSGVAGEDRSVWEEVRPLLEQSCNLDRTTADPSCSEAIVPFLIRTATGLVGELRLKWSARPANGSNPDEREELLRMVIPTEKLGEIRLTVRLTVHKTQINLKVASPEIQAYLQRHLAELKGQLNKDTYIVVGLTPMSNDNETKVDLWM
jgi:hypothetical protein